MLRFSQLGFSYAGAARPALQGVDLDLQAGEYLVLLGANGSGKSTLARLANGLLLPTEGQVWLDGVDSAAADEGQLLELRRRVALLMQDPDDQIVATTVEADVAFGPENLGLAAAQIRARVDAALAAVGLAGMGGRDPNTLSGGQSQRLAIAGVLAMEPDYLVLDEPGSMLDSAARASLMQLLADLRAAGHGILHITHDLGHARAADRVAVLVGGRLAFAGTPDELFARTPELAAWRLVGAERSPLLVRRERCCGRQPGRPAPEPEWQPERPVLQPGDPEPQPQRQPGYQPQHPAPLPERPAPQPGNQPVPPASQLQRPALQLERQPESQLEPQLKHHLDGEKESRLWLDGVSFAYPGAERAGASKKERKERKSRKGRRGTAAQGEARANAAGAITEAGVAATANTAAPAAATPAAAANTAAPAAAANTAAPLVLRDLSFEVRSGTLTLIAGASGAGKSTLLRIMAGVLKPTSGAIGLSAGQRLSAGAVGLVFQNPENQLFAATVAEDILFGPRNLGLLRGAADSPTGSADGIGLGASDCAPAGSLASNDNPAPIPAPPGAPTPATPGTPTPTPTPRQREAALVAQSLSTVGLDASYAARSPFALSGGEMRRVAIAGVVAMRRRFMLFDEPTAGLDAQGRYFIQKLMANLLDDGVGIVVVSHDIDEFAEAADRRYRLKGGQLWPF